MIDILNEWAKVYTMFFAFAGLVLFGVVAAILFQLAAMMMGRKADMVCQQFYYKNRLCYVEYDDHTGEINSMVDVRTGTPIPRPSSLRVDTNGNSPTLIDDGKQR